MQHTLALLWYTCARIRGWPGLQCLCIRMTSKHEYHYKGHEPYEQLLHAAYTWFDTPPLPPLGNIHVTSRDAASYYKI